MDGRLGAHIQIAEVPGELASYIHSLTTDVWMGREYAHKLIRKHNLHYEHFGMIQPSINLGWCRLDHGNLQFLYEDDSVYRAHFHLVIKTANKGSELWIKTFHRSTKAQFRSYLARGDVLQLHHPSAFEE